MALWKITLSRVSARDGSALGGEGLPSVSYRTACGAVTHFKKQIKRKAPTKFFLVGL